MSETCPTPTIPTATTHTGWLSRLIRLDCPEDPKRLVLLASAGSLILGFLALAVPAGYQIWKHGDLGGGAVGALIGAGGPLAGLAGYAHRKEDTPTIPSEQP